MKYLYLSVISFLLIISCKTQNQPGSSDTANYDSMETVPAADSGKVQTITFCPDLVKEILKSSPRYKQLTDGLLKAVKKNGGSSVDIILDKSPDPDKHGALDYSSNYEMQLTENYPDRQVNIAHFTFNPDKRILYEYDVVRDHLITIEYDQNLLEYPGQYCK